MIISAIPCVTFARPKVRRQLLRGAQRILDWCGASSLFVRAKHTEGAMILVYHGIARPEDFPYMDPRFSVSASVFEEQMRFLSRHRRVIGLGRLIELIERREPIPAGTVVITFDDGYKSTLEVAAPILERYRLPATLFLATGYVTREQAQFSDVLFSSFNFRTRHQLDLSEEGLEPERLRDPLAVRRAFLALEDRLTMASYETRERLLAKLVDQLRPASSARRLTLGWEDVVRLRKAHRTIDIGVHTRNHIDLTSCDVATAAGEITDCIEDLRREVGILPEHFAFPFGRANGPVAAAVSRAGFRSAAVTEPPALVTARADRHALPRFSAPPNMCLFSFFTSGAYPDLSLALLRRA